MTRLRRRLEQAKSERRGILMGFLPAGFPSPVGFQAAAQAAFDAGLDALEASMPGPAPALDGPLIQAAADQAAQHLTGISDALKLAASSRSQPDDTIIALAYAQTLRDVSADVFFDELTTADVDAYLLPQHPMHEQLEMALLARARGIDAVVFLHLQEDLGQLAASALDTPIIYLQSADLRTGGTFNPEKASERLAELAAAFGERPYFVCVGFGVRGPDEIEMLMEAGADGVIIGTRLVAAAESGPAEIEALVNEVGPALVGRRRSTARGKEPVV